MNEIVDATAKALCRAAGSENTGRCVQCGNEPCEMWPSFRKEALAAIRAIASVPKGWKAVRDMSMRAK